TPLDGLKLCLMCLTRDLLRFAMCPMVAPEIVFIERLHLLVHHQDARAGRVDRKRDYLLAANAALLKDLASRRHQRLHLVAMRLRRKVWIITPPMQRILRSSSRQSALLRVKQSHPNTQRPKIRSSNDRHASSPLYFCP